MRFGLICTHVRQSVRGANEHVYSSFNHYFGLFFQLKYIHELNGIKILQTDSNYTEYDEREKKKAATTHKC